MWVTLYYAKSDFWVSWISQIMGLGENTRSLFPVKNGYSNILSFIIILAHCDGWWCIPGVNFLLISSITSLPDQKPSKFSSLSQVTFVVKSWSKGRFFPSTWMNDEIPKFPHDWGTHIGTVGWLNTMKKCNFEAFRKNISSSINL